jgi:hypothetical protein
MSRDKREYGLSLNDREWVIRKKFGFLSRRKARRILQGSVDQSDKVLGAILFLSRPKDIESLEGCVELANENVDRLLNAATVKDERT